MVPDIGRHRKTPSSSFSVWWENDTTAVRIREIVSDAIGDTVGFVFGIPVTVSWAFIGGKRVASEGNLIAPALAIRSSAKAVGFLVAAPLGAVAKIALGAWHKSTTISNSPA